MSISRGFNIFELLSTGTKDTHPVCLVDFLSQLNFEDLTYPK